MKKHLKTCLAILFSIVLAMNSVSVSALALDNDNEQEMSTVENGENYEGVQGEDSEEVQAIDAENSSKSGGEAGETEETLSEETGQETTKQEDAEDVITTEEIRTEETAVEETAVETTAVETTSEAITGENEEETTEEMTSEAITEESEEDSVNMPEFTGLKIVDGVVIMVTAPEGVFPEESTLLVNKVSNEEQQNVDNAVDKTRNDNVNVAASYTYDIKVLNKDGEEIQPADEQKVKVIFTLAEAENENLTADIYHITGENGELSAEALDTTGQGAVVMAESDGFSYYTVEFTYDEKQYVMEGDTSVALTDILSYVGITKADGSTATDSDITTVSVSDESLFSASNESEEWIVTAHQAFHTDEWMKVTVDGVEYEIVVTDAVYYTSGANYKPDTSNNGDIYVKGVTHNLQTIFVNKGNTPYVQNTSNYSWADVTIDASGKVTFAYRNAEFAYGLWNVKDLTGVKETFTLSGGNNAWKFNITSIAYIGACAWLTQTTYNPTVNPTVTTPTLASNLTYNGSAQQLITVAAGSNSSGTLYYGLGTSSTEAPTTWYTSITDSNLKQTNVGTYYIWYKQDAASGYFAKSATYAGNVVISKATITPTIIMTGWTYGGTASNPSVSGNSGNGSVSYEYYTNSGCTTKTTTANGASATGGKPSYAGTYWVKATIAATTNYNSGTAIKSFTISKKALTVTANSQTITYGNSITTGTGQVTTATLASGDSLSAITLTPSTSNVTTSGTITPSAATIKNGSTYVTGNYNIAYNTGTLTINKANLTVTAKPKTIIYGDAPANDGVTYSEFKGSDSASSLGGSLSYTYSYSRYGNVGNTYTITPGGLTSSNYNITFAAGTLTVNQKEVGLTWSDTPLTYNGSPQKPTATATGLVNGDEIEVSVTGEQTNAGENYTATASALTGTKAGNYKLPASNTHSFSINGASMSDEVSATGYTGTYDAAEHNITVTAPSGATVKYRTTGSGDYDLAENPAFTDAGTHTVYYQVTKENYATVTGSATVQIDPIELTLNWSTDNTFTYNGLPQAPTASIEGVINSDDCTVSVSGAMTDYNADAYTATAVLNGTKAGNYTLPADKTTTFTIGRKDATVTAENQIITYGESIATGIDKVTITGLVNEDTLTAITLNPSTNDATTSGTITPVLATIKKDTTDVTNNYNITYTDGSLTINKKQITISGIVASDKTYDGTTNANLDYSGIDWAACGRVGSDNLTVSATGTFSDANIGTRKTVTISDLTLSGEKADNYELASSGQQTSTTADITAKALTIKADSDTKVYDGATHTKNSYSVTSGELADGDTIESVTVTGSQKYAGSSDNVPSAAVIKNSSGVDVTSNYNITYTNGTLTVTKKPLTITADSDTKVYDTTPLTKNNYTNTALAAGDTIESVTVTGTQTAVGESANVPSAAVIKNGDENVIANYDITYVNGTLKVTKKVVTITAKSDTKTYDGTALTNDGYTVSGLEAGDRVDIVTITGTQTKAGTSNNVPSEAVIKNSANEDANDNYTISYVNGTLEVTPKAVTITADSDTKVYDGTALVKDGYSITGGKLATGDRVVSVSITGSKITAGVGANVPSAAVIKNANGEAVTASYDITYENGTLEVTKKEVTITAGSDRKVYDKTPLTKDSYTYSELATGDNIESVTIAGSQTNAGESANVPSVAVIKNVNGDDVTESYDITYVNGRLEVTQKPITISGINTINKIYDGDSDVPLDYSDIDWSACGMEDGDELTVTAKGTLDDEGVGNDKNVQISDIVLGGDSVNNYILSDNRQQTSATVNVDKKTVTVTALKQTVAVNGEIENTIEYAELSGAVEGHKLAEITLTSGSTEKTTTEGVITPSEAKIVDGDIDVTDNYDITYIDGVMTVTKAEAEVVLDNGDDEAPASVTAVEVPNLLEIADEEAEEGKLVKVELSVKPVSESNVNSATVADVKKTVESLFAFVDMESVKVEYLEIDLTKYVDNVKDSAISDTGTPLEIILTYDTSKAGNPVIIRKHEGTVKVFTQLSSRASGSLTDATYYVEGDKIYMYSQYFSDFAIAYSVDKTFNVNLDDGNGNVTRQIVSEGAKFIPPADLAKDGYDFGGWYKDEAFTQKWNPDTDKVTSDIKLYAKWTKKAEPSKSDTPETKADTPETKVDTPKAATTPGNTAKSPATGDAMHKDIAFFLMIFAAFGMICIRFIKKKIQDR